MPDHRESCETTSPDASPRPRNPERPRWRDVAELLGTSPRSLAQPSIDQDGGGAVPVDRTSQTILLKAKKSTPLGQWWRAASPADRAEFVDYVTDLSGSQDEPGSAAVADLLADQSGTVAEAIEALELESGRTSYSREALGRRSAGCRRNGRHDADGSGGPTRPNRCGLRTTRHVVPR